MDLVLDIVTNEDSLEKKMASVDDISRLLSCGTKEGYLENLEFFEKWHKDVIPGDKITLALYEENGNEQQIVGVLRMWQSPYCDNKWLLEGIEVKLDKRRHGYGKYMVDKGLSLLKEKAVKEVYLNINHKNRASHQLAMGLGFEKCSEGCKNSFGHELKTSNHYKYVF